MIACASSADYFGDDTSFTVRSQTNLTWIRSFSSFSDAVEEVADAEVGVGMGTDVAAYIMENMMERIHGSDE